MTLTKNHRFPRVASYQNTPGSIEISTCTVCGVIRRYTYNLPRQGSLQIRISTDYLVNEINWQKERPYCHKVILEKHTHKSIAQLITSMLTKRELIQLATLLDGDAGDDFNECIQAEAYKVAPELFIDPELFEKAQETMNKKEEA